MTMWFLIIFGAYVCASARSDAGNEIPRFHKCCPMNQGLVRVMDFEESVRYECLDRERAEFNYGISINPLIIGDAVPVDYGNLEHTCDVQELPQLTSGELDVRLSVGSDNCYDKIVLDIVNETVNPAISKIIALSCVHNQTEPILKSKMTIDHIQKCCPVGESYDSVYHLCRKSKDAITEESLLKRLNVTGEFIYEVESGLHCKADQYGVELSEEFYSLEVEGTNLKVLKKNGMGGGRVFGGEWCVEQDFWRAGLVARACSRESRDCRAFGAICVRKCCPIGQHYRKRRCGINTSYCVPNNEEISFNISKYIEPLKYKGTGEIIGIRSRLRCPSGRNIVNSSLDEVHYELDKDGLLLMRLNSVPVDNYCLEAVDDRHCPDGDIHISEVICYIEASTKDFRLSFWLLSTSSVFLALTLIVYCSLPELHNLHGWTLICHVSMMLLAFTCLARVQYGSVRNQKICTALGYGIYFGFIAAFAWLNVMCLDIWWTFRSMRTVQPMRKADAERRRFLWYSLYAWSITIVLTLTMFLLDKYPVVDFLDADIGKNACFFSSVKISKTNWPHYIFFVIPMGLGSCINFVLFIMTARHCARVKSGVNRMQADSVGDRAKKWFRIDGAKYILTGKLWVVMGTGWVSEFLAIVLHHPEWLWSNVNKLNQVQGVIIFLILVFKPKFYYLIRKRLGLKKSDVQKQGRTFKSVQTSINLDERVSVDVAEK